VDAGRRHCGHRQGQAKWHNECPNKHASGGVESHERFPFFEEETKIPLVGRLGHTYPGFGPDF
jgi:hypothetical protein